MKTTNYLFLVLFCLTSVLVSAQTPPGHDSKSKKIKVIIDPGHGGEDDGAVFNKLKEKNLTLAVGLELRKLLESSKDFESIMTRSTDRFIPLDDRKKIAEDNKVQVFISIHANSSPSKKARGTEFYFENQMPTDEESMAIANRENSVLGQNGENVPSSNTDISNILTDLAHNEHIVMSQQLSQLMLESFASNLNVKAKAIRQAPFRVLLVTMPATLIELGYLTHPQDYEWLAGKDAPSRIAGAIFKGLKAFKEKLDKTRSHSVN